MKKAIILCLALAILAVPIYFYATIYLAHSNMIEAGQSYPEEKFVSDSGEYVLCTQIIDDTEITNVTFRIENAEDETIIFSCPDKYRAYDLKAIEWDDLDVIVRSGDVGTYRYTFSDGSWSEREAA